MLDQNDYNHVCKSVFDDLQNAFSDPSVASFYPEERYQQYCEIEDSGGVQICPIKTAQYALLVAKRLGFQTIHVYPFTNKKVPEPLTKEAKGYVSWLCIQGKEELIIAYDPKITQLKPTSVDPIRGKLLSKIILHEIGHASLQMKIIRKKLKKSKNQNYVKMDAEHEKEAWLYAAIVRGILIGAHSYWCRKIAKPERPDEGYKLA